MVREYGNIILYSTNYIFSVYEDSKLGSLKPVIFERESVFMNVLKKDHSPFVLVKQPEVSCIMSTVPLHPGHCIVLPTTPVDSW